MSTLYMDSLCIICGDNSGGCNHLLDVEVVNCIFCDRFCKVIVDDGKEYPCYVPCMFCNGNGKVIVK